MTGIENLQTLPMEWCWISMGDISEVKGGKRLPKGHDYSENPTFFPYIRVTDFENMSVNLESLKFLNPSTQKHISNYTISKNDIYISIAGSIGKVGLIPEKLDGANLTENAAKITDIEGMDRKFLCYVLTSLASQEQIKKFTISSNQPKLALFRIKQINVPLPPLPEQRSIVSKIELLFSELDNGISNLKLAHEQLKVYRQAVLKKAFEGELTRKWRERQTDLPGAGNLLEQIRKEREKAAKKSGKKMKSINPLTESQLSNIPNGWSWTRLGNLVEEPKYGTSKKCDYIINGIGVLRIPNILDGLINDSDLKFAQFDSAEIENYRLKAGDILTIRSNGSVDLVGKCALVSAKDEKHLYAGYLIRLRPISPLINSKYLLNCLSSIDLRNQIESKAKSTSGVNNINSGELQSLIIPLCSLPEQQAIVQEIETRLSVCDKIEQDIEVNLEKAEALRQSILKKAFEGKLLNEKELAEVRKAEDWEPVEVLLEKIKAEKAKNEKK